MESNKERVDDFWKSVPKDCGFCIDKDNNISFSHIVSLLSKNTNFSFKKGYVYEHGESTDEDNIGILQIRLDHKKYCDFRAGKLVSI